MTFAWSRLTELLYARHVYQLALAILLEESIFLIFHSSVSLFLTGMESWSPVFFNGLLINSCTSLFWGSRCLRFGQWKAFLFWFLGRRACQHCFWALLDFLAQRDGPCSSCIEPVPALKLVISPRRCLLWPGNGFRDQYLSAKYVHCC